MKHALLATAMVLGMSGTAWAHDSHEHKAGEAAHEHEHEAGKCETCGKEGEACECTKKTAKKDCGCGKNKKKDAKTKS